MLLVIDNYDSFTYNIVQYLGELNAEMTIRRNDEITFQDIDEKIKPERILISPGPGTPDDAGISLDVLKNYADKLPILGVCLGHQAIRQVFGGKVVRAPIPFTVNTPKFVMTAKEFFKSDLLIQSRTLPFADR